MTILRTIQPDLAAITDSLGLILSQTRATPFNSWVLVPLDTGRSYAFPIHKLHSLFMDS